MKKTLISGLLVLLLITSISIAEEEKDIDIVGVSNHEIECSIINPREDCQLFENIINVTLVTEKNISESDLTVQNDDGVLRATSRGCRMIHKDLFECYFEIDPIINVAELPKDYHMVINLYPLGGGDAFTEYLGELKIRPVSYADVFDIGTKKSMNKHNFDYIQNFVKDTIFNSGICTTMGITNITFDNIMEYEEELNNMGGEITYEKKDITLNRAIKLLAAFSFLMEDRFSVQPSTVFQTELQDILYYGITMGFNVFRKIPKDEDFLWSPWRDWGITDKIDDNCLAFNNSFSRFLDPLYFVSKRKDFLDCIEDKHFSECQREFWSANKYLGDNDFEKLTSLKIIVNGEYLRDESNICSGSEINLEYQNLKKRGISKIEIYGKDGQGCHHTINLESSIRPDSFLCGYPDKPKDGGVYEIVIPHSQGNVSYTVYYYDSPNKCKVYQQSIQVD